MLRSTLWAVLLFGAVESAGAQGQPQDFTGRNVTSIRYEPIDQPIDPHDLLSAQTVQVGMPLDRKQVAATIDRLYATGLYQDIKVYAEPVDHEIVLRFVTVAQRFVGHVQVRGKIKDPPNSAVILSNAQLGLGKPFDPETVETARQSIEKEMKANGLFKATVDATTIDDPVNHQVTIGFLVNAGKRARYELPVITGETKLPDGTITAATGWRIPLIHRWRLMSQSLTDKGLDGIEKKYAKKERLTASVDLTSMEFDSQTNRARAHLAINGGPRVSIRALESKVSKKNLLKYVPVYAEGAVDNDLLTEGARNLRDYFQSRGYPDADVTFRREPDKDDQEIVNYYISAGSRRRLVNVNIEGNNYFFEDSLRERMFLHTNSLLLRYGRYSESFRTKDEEAIADLYRSNGFRNVKVSSTVQAGYKGKENDLSVVFHIVEGRQWLVSKLEVEGMNSADDTVLHPQLASTNGQPFSPVNIETDRNRILQYFSARGFLAATFRYTLIPDESNQTVQLVYSVRVGSQEFVRKVIVSGLNATRPSLIDKSIDNVKPGEPISMAKISEASRTLSDLGVFSSVNSGLQDPDGTNLYKYVLYDLEEANRYSFNIGLGLEVGQFGQTTNSLSQAGGSKGISPIVSFDVNRLNFLGRGQTVSLQTKYSTLEQREALNYIIPHAFHSTKRTLTFSALYDTTQDVQTFSSKRTEASVQVSQRINRASTLIGRFAYRRVAVGDLYIPSLLVPQLLQAVRIGSLSFSYIQDHRDNPADAHRGFFNTVDTAVSGGFFGSQRSFARMLLRNATYTPLGAHFTFARQTQFGAIIPFNVAAGVNSVDAIPLPERFFGGGGVSMRGFGDNQAGPRDIGTTTETGVASPTATGFPIGGNALFFNSLELRFPLLGANISGVFFHDMGNIYTSLGDISFAYKQNGSANFNYAVQAPGFGIRYKTPLGPVRVDFSYALNPANYYGYSNSLTIQQLLACGNACPSGPQRLSHFNFFFSIGQAF
jgi:outer membrane protein insertion porin family